MPEICQHLSLEALKMSKDRVQMFAKMKSMGIWADDIYNQTIRCAAIEACQCRDISLRVSHWAAAPSRIGSCGGQHYIHPQLYSPCRPSCLLCVRSLLRSMMWYGVIVYVRCDHVKIHQYRYSDNRYTVEHLYGRLLP